MPRSIDAATCLLAALLLASPWQAQAQDPGAAPEGATQEDPVPEAEWTPRTGDDWVDTWMVDINRYGARYHDAFIDEIVRYQAGPRALVQELLVEQRWRPADVYFACAIAVALGRPCRELAAELRRAPADGWAGVLARLEVPPDGAPFRRVRQGIVASYDRWGRPITLDAQLRRALPDRAAR